MDMVKHSREFGWCRGINIEKFWQIVGVAGGIIWQPDMLNYACYQIWRAFTNKTGHGVHIQWGMASLPQHLVQCHVNVANTINKGAIEVKNNRHHRLIPLKNTLVILFGCNIYLEQEYSNWWYFARSSIIKTSQPSAAITPNMIRSKNTLGYSVWFIYTIGMPRARRSYTGYYPSLPS